MPRSSSSQVAARFAIPRTLLAGFVVAALATLVIAVVNFRSAETRTAAVQAMDRTTLAMRQLNLFNAAVKDAETGQRGYLLTGDGAYLQPYEVAVASLQQHMAELRDSAAEDPVHRQLVAQLEELSQQKLRELNETIALRKSGDVVGSMALVHSGAGKDIMDRMRDVADNLRAQQNQQLEARRAQWVGAAANSNLYSGGGSVVLLVLICISAAMTAREYRAKALQSWVSAGLTGLGQRIQGDHRLEDIGQLALEYLATYLKAPVGAGYVADCQGGSRCLAAMRCRANAWQKSCCATKAWWGRLRVHASCCMCATCRPPIYRCRPARGRPAPPSCWWRLRWKTARCLPSSSWGFTAPWATPNAA